MYGMSHALCNYCCCSIVVNIIGVNLLGYGSDVISVMFGAQAVEVMDVSNSSILVRINASRNNANVESVGVTIVSDTSAIISSAPNAWSFLVEGRVRSVTPSEGQIGTFVTLRGTNLLGNGSNITSVYLDGILTSVLNFTNTEVRVRINVNDSRRMGYVPGEVRLMADTGAIILADVSFSFRESGLITGFFPRIGREGTYITITGINLHAFGGDIIGATVAGIPVMPNSIQFNSSDPNTIIVRAGRTDVVTSGNIQLFIDTGPIVISNTTYDFTYVAPGNITMVMPSSGVEGVGVLITGDDLYIANNSLVDVLLAGAAVSRVVVGTRITIVVIAGPPLTITSNSSEVLITASDGSVTRGSVFTYNAPYQLNIIPSTGHFGTRVTILFPLTFTTSGDLTVLVDNVPATITSRNLTAVVISIPRAQSVGSYTVDILVENTNGELARLTNGFTYITEGVIIDVTPDSGQQGTVVTVTGDGLLGGGEVIKSATLAGLVTRIINSSNSTVVLEVIDNIDSNATFVGDVVLTANSGAVVRQQRAWTAVVPAMISTIQPSNGQFATIVSISGTNLLQDGLSVHMISLAGIEVYNILNVSSTAILVRASNASADLNGPVRVVLETGAYYESSVNWTYSVPTTISSVFPEIGAVGSTITIQLANFTSENITMVTIDNIPATILAMSGNYVSVTVPTGNYSSRPVTMVVETASGIIVTQDGAFRVEELGNITNVSPSIIQQGIEVTITGNNLLGISNQTAIQAVWLAGIPANRIIFQNSSIVIVEAGYNSTNVTGNIRITLNTSASIVGTLNTTIVSYYQAEILSVTPSVGYNATRFIISGINLIQPNSSLTSVMIGNITAAVERYNYDYIIARAGEPSISDVNVSMTISVLSQSGALIEAQDSWTYNPIPRITSVIPNIAAGGDNVTIFGMDLPVNESSMILIGGITVQRVFNFSSTRIEVQLSFSVGNPNLQQVDIINNDGTTVTSDAIFSYNETVDNSIISVTPSAGQNGTIVKIVFNNTLSFNITAVYLADVTASNITTLESTTTVVEVNTTVTDSNATNITTTTINIITTTITVMAGFGDNVTGDVFILTANGRMLGLQNGWRYLPVLDSSYVTPQRGQQGTLVNITVGASLLTTFNVSRVTLAGVNATIVNINDTSVMVEAGRMTSVTNSSDIVLYLQDGITLTIPQSWSYLSPINIAMVSNSVTGYYGTMVTIYGENFLNGQSSDSVNITEVLLAGTIGVNILSYNDTTIVCIISQFINSSQGPVSGPIVVRNSLGFTANSSGTLDFTYVQVDVMNVSPNQGQNGTMVTIQGVGLLAGATYIATVWLNNIPVRSILSANNSVIIVEADYSNMSTSLGDITYLMNTDAMVTAPRAWYYVAPAVVSRVTPANGVEGTVVSIVGTELLAGSDSGVDSVDVVYLDGVAASRVLTAFSTVIQVVAGYQDSSIMDTIPGAASVHLSTGAMWTSPNVTFTYSQLGNIIMITPSEGQNGTVVNITGTSLYPLGDDVMSVTLAGVSARIQSATRTFIQVITERPATLESFSGPVIIQAASGALLRYANNFTYLQEGIIFSVTPSQGQSGTQVKIEGQDLFGGGSMLNVVQLAGTAADIDINSNNSCVMVMAMENPSSINENITGDIVLISNTGAHVRRIEGWQYVQRGVINDITPPSGQYGTKITISGERLRSGATGILNITIGSVVVNNVIGNDTLITGEAGNPPNVNAFNGMVSIISSDSGILMSNYTWSYNQGGVISNFTPTSGRNSETINITGTNLFGSGTRIVRVTVAGVDAANITLQNDTFVSVVSGVSVMRQNILGPIILFADTGAIVQSTMNYNFSSPCNLNQYINTSTGEIVCEDCSSLCVSCVGPTNSECLQCSPSAFLVPSSDNQPLVNNTVLCIAQCMFATEDRQCVGRCEAAQYQNISVTENTTFCHDCNEMCAPNTNCSGPEPTECEQCRYFRYRSECIETCPTDTYADQNDNCLLCHPQCDGCTGHTANDCINCRNFLLTVNSTDTCVDQCPLNYYASNSTCQPCDPQCLGGCRSSGPFQCTQCRSAGIRRSVGMTECVSECSFSNNNIYYLDITSMCERCSDLCSTIDGCTGPTAGECRTCRNGTYTHEDTCIRDCSQLRRNNSTPFYNDDITQSCELCDSSCGDRGCTGPGSANCISSESSDSSTGTFEAGTGTIAIVIVICVLLFLLVLVCIVILLIQHRRSRTGKYITQEPNESSTEMTNRYAMFKESQETEFNKRATGSKSATSSKLPPAEVPTADDMYTDMSGNEDTIKKPLTGPKPPKAPSELYVDVPNAPQAGCEMYTDMTASTTANQDVGGEEYVDVPSPVTNVVANPGFEETLYEDTDQAVEGYKDYVKLQKQEPPAPPSLPPTRSKPSIAIPTNPLQDALSHPMAAQQQQERIYEEAPLEEQLYDAIGGGLPEATQLQSLTSKLPDSSTNVLPLPPKK